MKTDKIIKALPETELCAMRVVWQKGGRVTAKDVIGELEVERGWKKATIYVLLSRLEEKGYLSIDKSKYVHWYTALVTEEEYGEVESLNLIKRLRNSSLKNFIVSMIETDELSNDDIDELTELLNRKKEQNVD